jgi:hypothetical protein
MGLKASNLNERIITMGLINRPFRGGSWAKIANGKPQRTNEKHLSFIIGKAKLL